MCEEIEALTRQADRCDEEEDRVYQERTQLPDDLRDKKQRLKKVREMKQLLEARRSFDRVRRSRQEAAQHADPEARIMAGDFEYAYNARSVDGKSQVIVGQHVSPGGCPGSGSWMRWRRRAVGCRRSESGPRVLLGEEPAGDVGSEGGSLPATDRGEKRGKGDLDASKRHLVKADFRYDEERDGFHCPGGQLLRLKTTRKGGRRVYDQVPVLCHYRRC